MRERLASISDDCKRVDAAWQSTNLFMVRKEMLTEKYVDHPLPSWERFFYSFIWMRSLTLQLTYANQFAHFLSAVKLMILCSNRCMINVCRHYYQWSLSHAPKQARDENTGSHFTLMILKGRLHLIYSIGGVTGVHEIINSPISVADNLWHRVTFGLDRIKGRFVIIVDDSAPEVGLDCDTSC